MMEDVDDGLKLPSASQWVRGLSALTGLTMMLVGVVYAIRLFGWIVEGLRSPEKVTDLIKRWGMAMGGGRAFETMIGNERIPLSEILAVLVLGVGMWVLIRIAFMFISEGSKIVTHTLGEKAAIKRILVHALGAGAVKETSDLDHENKA
ncbi:hypothetical protein P3T73_07440 [Kiritimatiellota bacterium B12222]|nr:hypothetical protein P3T73_07440 [Kiritimatiellota bacterium B12222]